jgi:hypothetical protein
VSLLACANGKHCACAPSGIFATAGAAISYQLSAFSFQLSAISYQLSAFSQNASGVDNINHLSPGTLQELININHSAGIVGCPQEADS